MTPSYLSIEILAQPYLVVQNLIIVKSAYLLLLQPLLQRLHKRLQLKQQLRLQHLRHRQLRHQKAR